MRASAKVSTLRYRHSREECLIDEDATLDAMCQACSDFFGSNARWHQDLSYRVYRGQLIIKQRVRNNLGVRRFQYVIYAFLVNTLTGSPVGPQLFCIGWPKTLNDGFRMIDKVLGSGLYGVE